MDQVCSAHRWQHASLVNGSIVKHEMNFSGATMPSIVQRSLHMIRGQWSLTTSRATAAALTNCRATGHIILSNAPTAAETLHRQIEYMYHERRAIKSAQIVVITTLVT